MWPFIRSLSSLLAVGLEGFSFSSHGLLHRVVHSLAAGFLESESSKRICSERAIVEARFFYNVISETIYHHSTIYYLSQTSCGATWEVTTQGVNTKRQGPLWTILETAMNFSYSFSLISRAVFIRNLKKSRHLFHVKIITVKKLKLTVKESILETLVRIVRKLFFFWWQLFALFSDTVYSS